MGRCSGVNAVDAFPPVDLFAYSPGPLTPRGGWTTTGGSSSLVVTPAGLSSSASLADDRNEHDVSSAGISFRDRWFVKITLATVSGSLPAGLSGSFQVKSASLTLNAGFEHSGVGTTIDLAAFGGDLDLEGSVSWNGVGTRDFQLEDNSNSGGPGEDFIRMTWVGANVDGQSDVPMPDEIIETVTVGLIESDPVRKVRVTRIEIGILP